MIYSWLQLNTETFKSPGIPKRRKTARSRHLNETYVDTISDSSFVSDVETDDPERDPDYRETPLFKRLQQAKLNVRNSS